MTSDPQHAPATNEPDFVEDISVKLHSILGANGIDSDLARGVVHEFVEYLHAPQGWGGQPVYIKKSWAFAIAMRDREIVKKWDGTNTLAICREYRISRQQLHRIARVVRGLPISRAERDALRRRGR